MSRIVTERLNEFLAPGMPLNVKFEIAEELWRHLGPNSSQTLRFGPGVTVAEIVEIVEHHIARVAGYQIATALQRRFDWLAADDVKVKQELLNHLRDLDRALVVEATRLQAGVMVQHLQDDTARKTQQSPSITTAAL